MGNETTIDVKTLFDVETIRNDLGNDNSITNTPDVEITDDDGNVGGVNVGTANNFTDDELEDDVVTGEAYAFKFWSRSGPSSLGHSTLTVEKNRVYNETTNQFVTPGQVRINVSGGAVTNADIALVGVSDSGTDDTKDADGNVVVDFREASSCQPNMILHFTYSPKVEISSTYDGKPTNLVLRVPVNKWPKVDNSVDGANFKLANFHVTGAKRMDVVKVVANNRVVIGGTGLGSYQDIIIPITTDDIKTIKPGQTIDIYYGYGDNKIVAPMTYGTDTGLDKTAANNYITVRDFVVGQGNSANVGGTLVSTALD